MPHANFDLLFSKAHDSYHVRVVDSPAGSASAQFTSPFSDVELENLVLRLAQSRHKVRRVPVPQLDSARKIGGRLFDTVFTGGVRDCFRASLSQITGERGLRLRLRLTDVPEISGWPWELLYDSSLDRFLALSVETPIVRYLDLPEAADLLHAILPLRILLMVASPTDHPALDVEREVGNLNHALADLTARGVVEVDRVDVATVGRLQRSLSRGVYHIFHFIGHGALATETGEGLLIFEDEHDRGRAVHASTLGTLLHDHRSLRVAVLNACEGARTSRDDPFSGTAQSLIRQGIPAVIAMQFEISDDAAIQFSHEFYASLAAGHAVDHAVAEARKAIFADVSELEWATPVLYLNAPDARVFSTPMPAGAPSERADAAAVAHDAAATVASPSALTHADGTLVPIWVQQGLEVFGFSRTDGLGAVAWGSLTFVSLLTAIGLIAWGSYLRWFNLTTLESPAEWLVVVGLLIASVAAIVAMVSYLITRRLSPAGVARWMVLTSRGTPSIARLVAYVAVALAAALWIWSLPPVIADTWHVGAIPVETGWVPAQSEVDGIEEVVYREIQWHIGAGNRFDNLRLEVKIRPFDSVFFGRIQVQGISDRNAVLVPQPSEDTPLILSRLGATSPTRPGRLRFTIVRDRTVPELPPHVEIDVRLVRDQLVTHYCRALPSQFPGAYMGGVPTECATPP